MPFADPGRAEAYYWENRDRILAQKRARRASLREARAADRYPPHLKRLDPEPLRALIARRAKAQDVGIEEFLDALGLQDRIYQRMKQEGSVTLDTADRWCCRLGMPLSLVYPETTRMDVSV